MKKFTFGGDEFAARILPSALSILLSLGLLCSATLAYFTCTVSSRSNVIASASYSLTVKPISPLSESAAAEPAMIMDDLTGEEIVVQPPATEEEYTAGEGETGVAPAAESGVVPAAETDIPEVNAQTGITTTGSTASSSKNSNATYDEEGYEVVDAGISADAVSILTASLTEEEAAEDGGAGPKSITFNYDAAGLYYFEITAHGTARTGYCVISIGDESYYTTQIVPNSSITLGIAVNVGSTIEFTAQWGTSANYADENTDTKVYGEKGYEVIDHSGNAARYLSAEQPKSMASDELITADTTVADTTTDNIVDTTTDTTVADNTLAVIDNTTGEITTVVDNTTSDETSGATPGEIQGGGDAILTVDAAA